MFFARRAAAANWCKLNECGAPCAETDALCNVADFRGCASLSIAGTSRSAEHLAGHKIMRGKGEARVEEEGEKGEEGGKKM